jgi:hypothetical protein
VYTIDLKQADAPRIAHTYAAFVEAHTLACDLGLRVDRWFVDTDQTHEGKPVFSAEIAPLQSAQQKVLLLAGSSALLARRPPLTADDWPLVEQAWREIAGEFDPTEISALHLDVLHAAALLPPPGLLVPRPAKERPPAPPAARAAEAKPPAITATPAAETPDAPVSPEVAGDLAGLRSLLMAAFPETMEPVEGAVCRLSCVDVTERVGAVVATLRLFVFDLDGKEHIVRDIKEQECYLGIVTKLASNPKFPAFVAGWRLALDQLFRQSGKANSDAWMPHDLTHLSALDLKKISTAEEFRDSLLLRSRLGKLMLPRWGRGRGLPPDAPPVVSIRGRAPRLDVLVIGCGSSGARQKQHETLPLGLT